VRLTVIFSDSPSFCRRKDVAEIRRVHHPRQFLQVPSFWKSESSEKYILLLQPSHIALLNSTYYCQKTVTTLCSEKLPTYTVSFISP